MILWQKNQLFLVKSHQEPKHQPSDLFLSLIIGLILGMVMFVSLLVSPTLWSTQKNLNNYRMDCQSNFVQSFMVPGWCLPPWHLWFSVEYPNNYWVDRHDMIWHSGFPLRQINTSGNPKAPPYFLCNEYWPMLWWKGFQGLSKTIPGWDCHLGSTCKTTCNCMFSTLHYFPMKLSLREQLLAVLPITYKSNAATNSTQPE